MIKRILFFFAHPDDETFTVGGLLASLSNRNDVETIVYSATLGDAGKCGSPPICSREELSLIRKKELEKAIEILGADHLITGTYQDGKLNELEEGELTNKVKNLIHQYHPEVVITFPPHGISGHVDHKAIQQATYKAISEDKDTPVQKLFYVTVPSNIQKKPTHTDTFDDIDVTVCFKQAEAEKVRNALKAHRTQHLSVERVFPSLNNKAFDKFGNCEYFILAWKKENSSLSNELL